MRKTAFRVKPNKHPTLKFLVRTRITGKWQRKFFRTRVEAETYARLKETELLNQGREGAVSTPDRLFDRLLSRDCFGTAFCWALWLRRAFQQRETQDFCYTFR